jgi:5-methylcytosine-specific restriction protein A
VLVDRGYCAAHTIARPAPISDRQRGTAARRGYGATWQRARRGYLAKHPICVDPYKRHEGQVRAATDVDHIIAVDGPADPLFWDSSNWQPLCHPCHSSKTAREDGAFGRLGTAAASM